MKRLKIVLFFVTVFLCHQLSAQVEVEPWGNIRGIRVGGELMEFRTSIIVVKNIHTTITETGKERQRPMYKRERRGQTVSTSIDSLYFDELFTDIGNDSGAATVTVHAKASAPAAFNGVYLKVSLPSTFTSNATVKANNNPPQKIVTISALQQSFHAAVSEVSFASPTRRLTITLQSAEQLRMKDTTIAGQKELELFIPLQLDSLAKGQTVAKTIAFQASGTVDKLPVTLKLDRTKTGRIYNGFGGNFRLQNPRTDPQVIDYCLDNLDLAWGRVEMPWRFWQPGEDTSGIDQAKSGRLHPAVQKAMEMAQRLYKKGMPVILTAWSAPSWAIVGKPRFRPENGIWGNPIDHTKEQEIYKSIADYISYLKEQYGVEIAMFSFNESDLGINIRQTGEEHAALIKGLGAYFASRGLKTKLLLGDNSDATTYKFIYPAMADTATHRYIGAISFHSWRGWDKDILQKWADAATTLKLPLIVGEGSIDAQAWGYPAIFEEPIYALEEINLYTRLLAICQPASILQWQLTADYSPLSGGGIFGDSGPLRPTQRFWNLKQLSSTPRHLNAMSLAVTGNNLSAAALGDAKKGIYAIHIVNNGARRKVNLQGLPPSVKTLKMFVTDKQQSYKALPMVKVIAGKATFTLPQTAYVSLISQ